MSLFGNKHLSCYHHGYPYLAVGDIGSFFFMIFPFGPIEDFNMPRRKMGKMIHIKSITTYIWRNRKGGLLITLALLCLSIIIFKPRILKWYYTMRYINCYQSSFLDSRSNTDRNKDLICAEYFIVNLIQLEENNSGYWVALGNIYYKRNLLLEAIQAYTVALKIDPCRTGLLLSLGDSYYEVRNFREAIKTYMTLLRNCDSQHIKNRCLERIRKAEELLQFLKTV